MASSDPLPLSPALVQQAMDAANGVSGPRHRLSRVRRLLGRLTDYLLRLRSLPGQLVPVERRLARLAKVLKRAHGFRILEFYEVPQGKEAAQ